MVAKIKKNDQVKVIRGKDRGAEGKVLRHPQQRLQSAVERQDISLAEGVGQRAHGHPVRDGTKTGRGGRAHPLGG